MAETIKQPKQSKKQRQFGVIKAKSIRRKTRKKTIGTDSSYERQFVYRGYSIEELLAMTQDERLPLWKSRIRRKLLRGYDDVRLKTKNKIIESDGDDQTVRTHVRDIVVEPEMVGKKVEIYNGRKFVQIVLQQEMLGHVLGEYANGRTFPNHIRKGVGASKGSKHTSLK